MKCVLAKSIRQSPFSLIIRGMIHYCKRPCINQRSNRIYGLHEGYVKGFLLCNKFKSKKCEVIMGLDCDNEGQLLGNNAVKMDTSHYAYISLEAAIHKAHN